MDSNNNPKEVHIDSRDVLKKMGTENNESKKIAQASTECSYLNCIMLWNNDETTWSLICNDNQSDH